MPFFLWYLGPAFGMILTVISANAAPEDFYNARGKRDPFVPLVTQTSRPVAPGLIGVESIEDISIEGIVYDPKGGSMVIVNHFLLKEGDEQEAVKILKVRPEGVLLSVNGVEGFKIQHKTEQSKKDNNEAES